MLDGLYLTLFRARWLLLALLFAGLAAFPLLGPNNYLLYLMSLSFIMTISACGLNLIVGYAGQFNLAHAGFMAIGAYTVGILTVDHGWGFWPAFLVAGPITAALGYVGGLISLRLKEHFFAIFTLCVGFIIYLVIEKADGLTHGTVGIINIPAPGAIAGFSFEKPVPQYYLVLGFLVLAMAIKHRIVTSLLGRAFVSVRNSEDLAAALGVDVMRTKVIAFTLSTLYAGISGALFAGFVRFIGPAIALEGNTFDLTMYLLVGGLGTFIGPLIGTIALTWITESLQFLKEYRMVVFGPLLVVLVMYFPQGIVGHVLQRVAWRQAHSAEGADRAEPGRDA